MNVEEPCSRTTQLLLKVDRRLKHLKKKQKVGPEEDIDSKMRAYHDTKKENSKP